MEQLSKVFFVIGAIMRLQAQGGRRLLRAELENRYRLYGIEHNAAQYAPMAPRKARRARVRELRKMSGLKKKQARENFVFRPVYGYRGPGAAKS